MKFLVDEMPKTKDDCPLAEWHTFPPIVEKAGDYICTIDKKLCSLYLKDGCIWLKEQEEL